MKKITLSLFVLVALFILGTSEIKAQEQEKKDNQTTQTARTGFVDNNSDGVCDNYDGVRPGKGKGPGNGQGLGRADGKRQGQGKGLRNGSGNGTRKLDGSGNGQRKLDGSGNSGNNTGNGQQLRDGSGPNCTTPAK